MYVQSCSSKYVYNNEKAKAIRISTNRGMWWMIQLNNPVLWVCMCASVCMCEREKLVGEKSRVWKDAIKGSVFFLPISNYFIRLRIYMNKRKASVPFSISSSCQSSAIPALKGRKKGGKKQRHEPEVARSKLTATSTTRGQCQRIGGRCAGKGFQVSQTSPIPTAHPRL